MPPRHKSRYDSEDDSDRRSRSRWARTPRRSRDTSSSRYGVEDRSMYPPDPGPLNEPRSYSQYSRSSGESQRDIAVEVDNDVQSGQRVYHQTGTQPIQHRTGNNDASTRAYTQPELGELAYRSRPVPSVDVPTSRLQRYPVNSTHYERRAQTLSLVELTGHQPGPPRNLPQYSYPAEFRSPSLSSRPLDTDAQQSSLNPLFSSSIHSYPSSVHNSRDIGLVMFQRDMGTAADPRDQIVIFSRRRFHYPDEDALLFTSPVHFPIVDDRGNVEHYKVCEHVLLDCTMPEKEIKLWSDAYLKMLNLHSCLLANYQQTDNGIPSQCKAFHTPVHTSTVSIRGIHPEDTHFYSAAIIPRDHRMFRDHPSTSRMITVDHSVTFEEVANQYNSQQVTFARRYKDWINSDSGKLRLSQERYITDIKDNIRLRENVLKERKRELENNISSKDVIKTLQDGLKQYDIDGHQATSRFSPATANSKLCRFTEDALRQLEDMVQPLSWLREDEERLKKEKGDLRGYYRSLDWMN
ncbi:hypothetical protein L486_02259 [Kwoniella mangroviensis CBS 10435]|uniref:Uncharacterized protein n=1 Tax=Kwoniella mangroviensis CBS 10435 TaxID=1331196 RepID=A0A1B9IVN5_9TREE|nr:hypothetical protein L486_02259 [Kwoniella mangroviensis CBS 10435]